MNERLYRSRSDRMLAGVAGGLAEMWGADPSLVRIVWALLVILTGGIALVVYIVMAIVVPEGDPLPWPPSTTGDISADPLVDPVTGLPVDPAATGGVPAAASGWTAAPPHHVRSRPPRGDSSTSVPLILGGFLIILGGFFLVREFLPQIQFDWFWPAMLIVLGVVILASALRRDRGGPGASS
jgi:phage shock protein C